MRTRSPWVTGLFGGLAAIAACLAVCGVAWAQPGTRLTIAPRLAHAGTRVTVKGFGFRPHLPGVVLLGGKRVASFRAGPRGRFRTSFLVPAGSGRRWRVVAEQSARARNGLSRRLRRAATGLQVLSAGALDNAIAGSGSSGIPPGSGSAASSPVAGAGGSTGGSGGPTGSSEASKGTQGTKGAGGSKGTGGTGGSEGSGGSSGATTGSWWIPPKQLTWYWQLQGTINNNEPVAAYDIDGFETSASEVATLHAQGKRVICYIDVGTYEPSRPDSAGFPAAVLGSGVQGWPGEQWLDISNLSALEPIMTARLQMCKEKGFDALEPDNMDGFENGSGFPLTAAQQLTYDEWVASEAHSLGMAVLQKNDGEQTAQLEPHFDGALDEQCNQYSECAAFQAYLAAGKPVLNAEYELSTSSFCVADATAGIMGARYGLQLDGSTFEPCW